MASDATGQLAAFLAQRSPDIPDRARIPAKERILDTLGAIISGATLKVGEMAITYGRSLGGAREAQIIPTKTLTSAVHAALVNGILGHCDETDDVEPVTKAHPGCSLVPAAWAMAERENATGEDLLWAVVAGYDTCCRVLRAMDPDLVRASHRSVESIGATFGASAAAAVVAGLDETRMRHVLSYAAQQASGVWSWMRDPDHVEKAFDFGGMGARNGVHAATMVQAGFTGVPDIFEGEHNILNAFSSAPRPQELTAGLGERFFVAESAIKPYSVGYPIQAALEALLQLMREHRFTGADVQEVVARLPWDGAAIVDNRAMPAINLQHVLSMALVDGDVTFASCQSHERVHDPAVRAIKARVRLRPERSMVDPTAPRQAAVDVTLTDGRSWSRHVRHARGAMENPLDMESVSSKARSLIGGVLGAEKTERLIGAVNSLESLGRLRDLRALLQR